MPRESIPCDVPPVAARIAAARDIEALADQVAANLRDGWEHGTAADARDAAPYCIRLLILAEGDADLPTNIRDRVRSATRRLIDALDQRFPGTDSLAHVTTGGRGRWGREG